MAGKTGPLKALFSRDGEMARRIVEHDWFLSLGPIERWPLSLTTTVGLMIHSPVPMVLLWGQDGVMIYNDAYSVFAGGRHPALLGSKVREGWPEVADFNDNVMRVGLAGGTLAYKDQELTLHRSGEPEQVWMNLDYSPVYNEAGEPGGVIAIVVETTERVLSERRLAESSARQRRFFEQAPGFIIVMSGPEHVVEFVNETHRQVFGSAEWIGMTIRDAFPSIAGQGFYELLDQVYATGDPVTVESAEVRFQRSSDEPADLRYLTFVYAPLFDEQGVASGVFCDGFDVTEERRAQEKSRASEAQLRQLNADLEQEVLRRSHVGGRTWQLSPEILGVANTEGVFESSNPAWRTTLGWSQEDLSRIPFIDLVHPDDVAKTLAAFEGLLRGEAALRFENRYQRKDGVYRWLSWVAVPEGGKFYCSARDITDQVAAATERDRIFEISHDLFGVASFDGYLKSINPAWSEALGRPQAELLSKPFAAIIHPDDLAMTANVVAALASGQAAHQFLVRLIKADGEAIAFAWSAVPDAATDSGLFYMVGRDITADQARAAELVQKTAERNRLWERSQDLLVIVGLDGIFRAANPAWTTVLGWSQEEVVGQNHLNFVHPDDHPVSDVALNQVGDGAISPVLVRCRHKDGSWRWISWMATDGDGVVFASGRNVTAERQAASDLAEAQAALRQAQKMEAVGQLTGGIAHDFNNLLAGISGSLELLQNRLTEGRLDGVERYIEAAQSSARRAAALTQRLLAFSRRQTLDPKPTDANRLIHGMEELIRRSVGPSVELQVVGAVGLWAIKVDPSQLENALLNLCINGRDAMAPDGGRLTIETSNKWLDARAAKMHELAPGEYVSICVTDTGTGMSADVIDRAFEPFFTTKPLGQGTGLGLSMIYGFVRQSGGQVRIDSELGKGATICLYLPRHVGGFVTEDDSAPMALSKGPDANGETVLVVDDENTIRMLVVEVLDELGFKAIEAADGPGALRLLQSDARIALLVTDVGLPGGVNGRQIADAARLSRPDLKVLFITGYAEKAVVGDGNLEPGMQVLTKPFLMTALAAKVRDLIEQG